MWSCITAPPECTYFKAGGTVKQLNHMPNAGFGGLRESGLQTLHHKQHQDLPGQSRSVLQSQQHQLQGLLLHGCGLGQYQYVRITERTQQRKTAWFSFDLPGPRNWQPLARTAAHKLEESCWGFWCCRMSSVTVRSPSERAARMARTRPSSSTSWQCTRVTSFLCMGLLSMLCAALLNPTPKETNPSGRWLHK